MYDSICLKKNKLRVRQGGVATRAAGGDIKTSFGEKAYKSLCASKFTNSAKASFVLVVNKRALRMIDRAWKTIGNCTSCLHAVLNRHIAEHTRNAADCERQLHNLELCQ